MTMPSQIPEPTTTSVDDPATPEPVDAEPRRRTRAARAAALAAALAVVGCGNVAESDHGAASQPTPATIPEVMAHDDGEAQLMDTDVMDGADLVEPIDRFVTEAGVIEAAMIILSDGDLEQALASGLITEAEVDAALQAIETGTISDFLDP